MSHEREISEGTWVLRMKGDEHRRPADKAGSGTGGKNGEQEPKCDDIGGFMFPSWELGAKDERDGWTMGGYRVIFLLCKRSGRV